MIEAEDYGSIGHVYKAWLLVLAILFVGEGGFRHIHGTNSPSYTDYQDTGSTADKLQFIHLVRGI